MKVSRLYPAIGMAALVLLAACAQKQSATEPESKPVATVNGHPLSRDLFNFVAKSMTNKPAADLTEEQRNQILDRLISAEVVAQQAEKDGLDKKGDTPQALAVQRLQLLEEASAEAYLKDRKPTDAELKAEYDTQIASLPKTEYKARHILVKTEDEAKAIIEKLNKKSAKFEDLAKSESIDGSKTSGGELGWFKTTSMVKPFGDAVMALKKGEITQTPVKTDFGYHVIQLEDTRDSTPPPFDSVKDRLAQSISAKKFKAYQDELLKNAKVEKSL
jgi:peptidyl-prolyl cis-trans isomerase C